MVYYHSYPADAKAKAAYVLELKVAIMSGAEEGSPKMLRSTLDNYVGLSFEESNNSWSKMGSCIGDAMVYMYQMKRIALMARYLVLSKATQENIAIQSPAKFLKMHWLLMLGKRSLNTSRAKESGSWFQKRRLAKPLGAHPSQSDGLMLTRATKSNRTIGRDSQRDR